METNGAMKDDEIDHSVFLGKGVDEEGRNNERPLALRQSQGQGLRVLMGFGVLACSERRR